MLHLKSKLGDQVSDAKKHAFGREVMYKIIHNGKCIRVTLHDGITWLNDKGYSPEEFNFRTHAFEKAVDGYLERMTLRKAEYKPSEEQL